MQEIEDAIRSQIASGSAIVALGNDGEDMTPAGGDEQSFFNGSFESKKPDFRAFWIINC